MALTDLCTNSLILLLAMFREEAFQGKIEMVIYFGQSSPLLFSQLPQRVVCHFVSSVFVVKSRWIILTLKLYFSVL
jgi:hypothetical protein